MTKFKDIIKSIAKVIFTVISHFKTVIIIAISIIVVTIVTAISDYRYTEVLWMFIMLSCPLDVGIAYLIMIIRNIYIYRHGDCFDGMCVDCVVVGRTKLLVVEWTNKNNKVIKKDIDSIVLRRDFPFSIKVYCLENNIKKVNLGLYTIVPEIIFCCCTLLISFPFIYVFLKIAEDILK